MADDVLVVPGTGGTAVPVATDEIAGRHHQLMKLEYGPADSATMVSDSTPLPVQVKNANTNGQKNMAGSTPVVIASDQTSVPSINGASDCEPVAASATDQVLGTTGAVGDYLNHIVIQPADTTPGTVIVKDGASAIYTFPAGLTLPSALPVHVIFGVKSKNGGFSITTGVDVSVLPVGRFT